MTTDDRINKVTNSLITLVIVTLIIVLILLVINACNYNNPVIYKQTIDIDKTEKFLNISEVSHQLFVLTRNRKTNDDVETYHFKAKTVDYTIIEH